MKNLIIISTAALLLTACSSVSKTDFDALKSQVDANTELAKQANVNAQDAKTTALKTEEKLNRVFRRSQMK